MQIHSSLTKQVSYSSERHPFGGVSEEKKDEAAIVEREGLCFSTPVNLGAFEVLLVVSLFLHRS